MGRLRFTTRLRNTLRGMLGVTAPLAPSGLAAFQRNGASAILTWTDNSSNETAFSIEQDGVEVATPVANATSATISSLTTGTPYSFRMRSKLGAQYSSYTAPNVSITPAYQYGYPGFANNIVQANVVAQWLFDEASGNIVDEVAGLTLTKISSPTYAVDTSAYSPSMALGITTTGGNFGLGTPQATIDPGTSDCVLEWVCKRDSSVGNQSIFDGDPTNAQGWEFYFNNGGTAFSIFIKSDAPGAVTVSDAWTITDYTGDGLYHKYRIKFARAGNAEMFIDGVSQGTIAISTLSGKVVSSLSLGVGGSSAGGLLFKGTLTELRWTVGNATNISVGPGGG